MPSLLVESQSARRKGEKYKVEWEDGYIWCSCPDFFNRQRICKHCLEVIADNSLLGYLPKVTTADPAKALEKIALLSEELKEVPFLVDPKEGGRLELPTMKAASLAAFILVEDYRWALAYLRQLLEKEGR